MSDTLPTATRSSQNNSNMDEAPRFLRRSRRDGNVGDVDPFYRPLQAQEHTVNFESNRLWRHNGGHGDLACPKQAVMQTGDAGSKAAQATAKGLLDSYKRPRTAPRTRTFACEYPGRECVASTSGTYKNAFTCSEKCVKRAPRVTALSVKYGRDVPLLAAMVKTYSKNYAHFGGEWRKGEFYDDHSGACWLKMKDDGSIVAAMDIPKGTRCLTAPAAIVDGSLQDFKSVLVTLPALLLAVEGLTQLPQLQSGAVDPRLLEKWQDLVPIDAIVLADAVQRNAVLLPTESKETAKYAVSVLLSMLPHRCDANVTAIVGTCPVERLWNGSMPGRLSEASFQPAVAVYAFKDIAAGEAITVSYGDCVSTSAIGFACTRTADQVRCRAGQTKGPQTLEDLKALAEQDASVFNEWFSNKAASVSQPSIASREDFTRAILAVVRSVQVDVPKVNYNDAKALVDMWKENKSHRGITDRG